MYLGGEAGMLGFGLGLTVLPFSYLTLRAREVMKGGFDHADVGPAYAVEIEQAREERSRTPGAMARFLEMATVALTKVSAILLVSSWLVSLAWQGQILDLDDVRIRFLVEVLQMAMFVSPVTTIAFGTAYHALANRYRDPDTELWAGIWRGRIGRAAFAMAKRLLGKARRGAAITHRATELSLGLAAEELFEGLPKDTRRALADLPSALKRLQHDAQELRKRRDELADALGEVSETSSSREYAELVELRNVVEARLSDAVGALESIRLNLLRLHAGSATVESVTTHLNMAAEVSEEVERLIAGQDEVARYLSFPRTPASTPA
jgi:serine/threonine-protein kinase